MKIPYQQGYFLMGWIPQNSANVAFVNRAGSSKTAAAPSVPAPLATEVRASTPTSVQLDWIAVSDLSLIVGMMKE
ncbi:MAG: hypothetical protein R2877_03590 [Bdellovibrionota bacterium]